MEVRLGISLPASWETGAMTEQLLREVGEFAYTAHHRMGDPNYPVVIDGMAAKGEIEVVYEIGDTDEDEGMKLFDDLRRRMEPRLEKRFPGFRFTVTTAAFDTAGSHRRSERFRSVRYRLFP
jgi:hypothetical protein